MTITITVPIEGTSHDAAYFQPGELTDADLFTCAYTDGPHAYSIATIQSIRARGKGILWNHERGQLDLAGGYQAGVTAASEAMAPVIAAGTPQNGTVGIVYSVDGSVAPVDFPKYVPGFQAIRAGHAGRFLIGFYGELALCKYLKGLGLVDTKCWLSGSTSFPGYNPNDPDVGLIQTVGTDIPNTDRDLVTDAAHLGVWWPAAAAQPPTGDDDMINLYQPILGTIPADVLAAMAAEGATPAPYVPTFKESGGAIDFVRPSSLPGVRSFTAGTLNNTQQQLTAVNQETTQIVQVDYADLNDWIVNRHAPGALVRLPRGWDAGAGQGTPIDDYTAWVPMPGSPPAVNVNVTFPPIEFPAYQPVPATPEAS